MEKLVLGFISLDECICILGKEKKLKINERKILKELKEKLHFK